MSGTGGSFSHVSLHIGGTWMVRCSTYDDTTPILSIDAGSTALSITPAGRDATGTAVQFARELARRAQEFATEVERMHTAGHADTGGTEGGTPPAGSKAA